MKNKKLVYLSSAITLIIFTLIGFYKCCFYDEGLRYDTIEYLPKSSERVTLSYKNGTYLEANAENQTSFKLTYSSKIKENTFYVIKCFINMEESYFENTSENAVTVLVDPTIDYNGNEVIKGISYDEYITNNSKHVELNRVIKTDKHGNLRFDVCIGSEYNLFRGTLDVVNVEVIPIDNSSNYTLLCSDDNTIRMVFLTDDLNKTTTDKKSILEWLNTYSLFRKDIKWLIGDLEPYNGASDFILTEQFDFFGLAGNPIYINSSFVVEKLNAISLSNEKEKANLIWEYIHELSHTFDGISDSNIEGIWNFDPEFFATLKTTFALGNNGFGMINDGNTGTKIVNYFSRDNTLKNGVYSSDGLVYTLLSSLGEYDNRVWLHLNNVFKNLNQEHITPSSSNEKFTLFWNALNQEYGFRVESLLSEKEWNAVKNKYNFK